MGICPIKFSSYIGSIIWVVVGLIAQKERGNSSTVFVLHEKTSIHRAQLALLQTFCLGAGQGVSGSTWCSNLNIFLNAHHYRLYILSWHFVNHMQIEPLRYWFHPAFQSRRNLVNNTSRRVVAVVDHIFRSRPVSHTNTAPSPVNAQPVTIIVTGSGASILFELRAFNIRSFIERLPKLLKDLYLLCAEQVRFTLAFQVLGVLLILWAPFGLCLCFGLSFAPCFALGLALCFGLGLALGFGGCIGLWAGLIFFALVLLFVGNVSASSPWGSFELALDNLGRFLSLGSCSASCAFKTFRLWLTFAVVGVFLLPALFFVFFVLFLAILPFLSPFFEDLSEAVDPWSPLHRPHHHGAPHPPLKKNPQATCCPWPHLFSCPHPRLLPVHDAVRAGLNWFEHVIGEVVLPYCIN